MIQRLLPAVCVCVLFTSFMFISPSSAKQPTGSCIKILDPIRPGETASVVQDYQCFSTFAETIAYVSKGQVLLPHSTTPDDVTQEMVDHIAAVSGRVLIGIQYELPGYRTDPQEGWISNSIYTETSATCNGHSYSNPSIRSRWNNVIESAHGYSGCNVFEHWDNVSWTGDSIFCTPGCADMGSMNNRASSWRLRQ